MIVEGRIGLGSISIIGYRSPKLKSGGNALRAAPRVTLNDPDAVIQRGLTAPRHPTFVQVMHVGPNGAGRCLSGLGRPPLRSGYSPPAMRIGRPAARSRAARRRIIQYLPVGAVNVPLAKSVLPSTVKPEVIA